MWHDPYFPSNWIKPDITLCLSMRGSKLTSSIVAISLLSPDTTSSVMFSRSGFRRYIRYIIAVHLLFWFLFCTVMFFLIFKSGYHAIAGTMLEVTKAPTAQLVNPNIIINI